MARPTRNMTTRLELVGIFKQMFENLLSYPNTSLDVVWGHIGDTVLKDLYFKLFNSML